MKSVTNLLKRLTIKIYLYFIVLMLLYTFAAVVITARPFFYVHNGLLKSIYSNRINDDYIKTDVEVEWGNKIITIRNYKYIYEVDGVKYTKNFYQDLDAEYIKGFYVYYNKNNPSDAFVYNEGFKFDSSRLIISIVLLLVGLLMFIYVVRAFFKVFVIEDE